MRKCSCRRPARRSCHRESSESTNTPGARATILALSPCPHDPEIEFLRAIGKLMPEPVGGVLVCGETCVSDNAVHGSPRLNVVGFSNLFYSNEPELARIRRSIDFETAYPLPPEREITRSGGCLHSQKFDSRLCRQNTLTGVAVLLALQLESHR